MSTSRILVGTSGYVYRHWRGRFYPPDVPAKRWLEYYATVFDTLELNSTFYRLPDVATFRRWRDAVPAGFVFAVKASRFLTHVKRLRDPERPLALLLRRARYLGDHLGPVLFQLPATFHLDLDRLDAFLDALRRQRLVPGLRAALEVRHPSWLDATVFSRLRDAGVALCLADWDEVPVRDVVTANFVYVRRHGSSRRYGGRYPETALRRDAEAALASARAGRDVYEYFNNDAQAYAVANARRLRELVSSEAAGRRLAGRGYAA